MLNSLGNLPAVLCLKCESSTCCQRIFFFVNHVSWSPVCVQLHAYWQGCSVDGCLVFPFCLWLWARRESRGLAGECHWHWHPSPTTSAEGKMTVKPLSYFSSDFILVLASHMFPLFLAADVEGFKSESWRNHRLVNFIGFCVSLFSVFTYKPGSLQWSYSSN